MPGEEEREREREREFRRIATDRSNASDQASIAVCRLNLDCILLTQSLLMSSSLVFSN